jgi:SET domain-containing protein
MIRISKFFRSNIIEKSTFLYVDNSAIHGLGVFTQKIINRGEIIEKCPLILMNEADSRLLEETALYHYYFIVENSKTPSAIGLGYSSLYNHAAPSNASYHIDISRQLIIIKAHRFIQAGEEITINYHGHPADMSTVTFSQSNKTV